MRLPAAACDLVGLKTRHGAVPEDGVFPLCPSLDTVGPMARTVGEVAALWSVLTGRQAPEPRLRGLTVGVLRRAPDLADGRETERSDAADVWASRLEGLGARVVEAAVPGPSANLWPVFDHEAARSHAATFPSRADEYGPRDPRQARCRAAGRAGRGARRVPRAPRVAAAGSGGRPLRQPVRGDRLAPEDADELEVRLPLSSFMRWVNLLGWAALAIGNLQLIAPADETVLAAGLAWERG